MNSAATATRMLLKEIGDNIRGIVLTDWGFGVLFNSEINWRFDHKTKMGDTFITLEWFGCFIPRGMFVEFSVSVHTNNGDLSQVEIKATKVEGRVRHEHTKSVLVTSPDSINNILINPSDMLRHVGVVI